MCLGEVAAPDRLRGDTCRPCRTERRGRRHKHPGQAAGPVPTGALSRACAFPLPRPAPGQADLRLQEQSRDSGPLAPAQWSTERGRCRRGESLRRRARRACRALLPLAQCSVCAAVTALAFIVLPPLLTRSGWVIWCLKRCTVL